MQITRRRLKEIIKEEMDHLAKTGDLEGLTESEKMAFEIILEKLSPEQLREMGLTRIDERPSAQQKKAHKKMHAQFNKKIKDLKDKLKALEKIEDLPAADYYQKRQSLEKKIKELEAQKKDPGHSADRQAVGMRS